MFNSAVKGTGWTITRILLGIAAFALFINQMIFVGNWLSTNHNQDGRKISAADYGSLTNGEKVYGQLQNVVSQCGAVCNEYVCLNYYLVNTGDDKFIVFRVEEGSKCDNDIKTIISGGTRIPYFIGYVKEMTDSDYSTIAMQMLTSNTLGELGIRGKVDEHLTRQVVDVSTYENYSDERIVIASVVGGLLMLGLSILFLKKPVKDAVYSIGVARGKIQPYMPEVDFVHHKEEFEKYEEINPDNAEDLEYYENYKRDSIDFNKEQKKKTAYGDDYKPPVLEKDIPTYESYKYDSLDFAQEEVEKKDINKF